MTLWQDIRYLGDYFAHIAPGTTFTEGFTSSSTEGHAAFSQPPEGRLW